MGNGLLHPKEDEEEFRFLKASKSLIQKEL
jgi:hypothetical protein